jgi:hypothetical protein
VSGTAQATLTSQDPTVQGTNCDTGPLAFTARFRGLRR